MYMSDRNALQYASRIILVLVPFFSSLFSTWSWIVEMLLLFAIFVHAQGSGLRLTRILLFAGYLAAIVPVGGDFLGRVGFAPWAGILYIELKDRRFNTSQSMFWSLVFIALISALPVIQVVQAALQPKVLQDTIRQVIDYSQQQDILATLEKQGMTSSDLEGFLNSTLPVYYQLLPAIAGIIGMLEFGFSYFIFRYGFKNEQSITPFLLWHLPWYAVWVAIIGLAAYLGGDYLGKGAIEITGLNLIVMMAAICFILGFSCTAFFVRHPKMPRLLAIVLIFAGVFFPFFVLLGLVIIGLFDLVFDFRRIPEKIEEGKQ
ncbi:MAG: hypothetical protein AWM53_01127 [Candidatus Dichloromethanomonas elyunquensis]|nr:MAG: hypothetical protein AWM53_01127 [Candidatus Dichloromethanomonas elyunquensis]